MSQSTVSKAARWTGWTLCVLPALLLIFSAGMKFAKPAPVVEGFAKFGYPEHLLIPLGAVELACAIIYLVPATAVLGAILVTGYLGGAIATTVRVGDPSYAITALMGILVWLGLFLREPRLRALIPIRR